MRHVMMRMCFPFFSVALYWLFGECPIRGGVYTQVGAVGAGNSSCCRQFSKCMLLTFFLLFNFCMCGGRVWYCSKR